MGDEMVGRWDGLKRVQRAVGPSEGLESEPQKKKNPCAATAMLAWSYRKRTRYVVGCSGKSELLRNCKDGFSAAAKLDRLRYRLRYESSTVEKG